MFEPVLTGGGPYYVVFAVLLTSLTVTRTVRARQLIFLAASYAFYASWGAGFLAVLLVSSLLNFAFGSILRRRPTLVPLAIGIALNVLLLAFCKYLVLIIAGDSEQSGPLRHLVRPLGISFWTLQGISYLFDLYREEELDPSPVEFFLFMAFWPTVLAGPICRLRAMLPQFRAASPVGWNDVSAGMTRIVQGLFMKLVLAQLLAAALANAATDAAARAGGGLDVWVLAVAFGFQLFFDFAGYSHLAIGAARIFGIRVPENFDQPFLSVTPSMFWTRWHMSFSFWIRDYVFVPLATLRRTWSWSLVAILASMTLVGAWHEMKATFILWGVYHGVLLVAHRLGQRLGRGLAVVPPRYTSPALPWACTFALVSLGWIVFYAPDVSAVMKMFHAVITPHGYFATRLPARIYVITAAVAILYFAHVGVSAAVSRLRSQWASRRSGSDATARPVGLAGLAIDCLDFSAARLWWWLGPALAVIGIFAGLAMMNERTVVRPTPFVYTLF